MEYVPTLKELYEGVNIDLLEVDNKHLKSCGLSGNLSLKLVEVPSESVEIETEDDDFEDFEDDEEEDEEDCEDGPEGCPLCEEYECTGPWEETTASFTVTELQMEIGVPLKIAEQDVSDWIEWRKFDESDMERYPGICRFINQINEEHGL